MILATVSVGGCLMGSIFSTDAFNASELMGAVSSIRKTRMTSNNHRASAAAKHHRAPQIGHYVLPANHREGKWRGRTRRGE